MLNPGGLLRISIKESDKYTEVSREDQFGFRCYYHYSKEDIREIAGEFQIVKMITENKHGQDWLEIILRKA